MGLHLTGKGSILDAIGGGLNEAGNAVISGIKDVSDLGSEGIASITNNPTAYQNASNAISNNDRNLSGGSFATNLGGLSQDLGITQDAKIYIDTGAGAATGLVNGLDGQNQTSQQAIGGGALGGITKWASNNGTENEGSGRRLAGNALMTGVNLATLGRGKAAEQAIENLARRKVGDSVAGKAISRIFGSSTSAGAYGAGQGASNAVSTAKNAKEAVTDIYKPALQNAELGGLIGGITTIPSVAKGTVDAIKNAPPIGANELGMKDVTKTPEEQYAEMNGTTKSPNAGVTEENASPAQLGEETHPSTTEPLPPEPHPVELAQATQNLHESMQDPGVDWTKVAGANDELAHSTQTLADSFKARDSAMQGGNKFKVNSNGTSVASEHTPFYAEVFSRTGKAPSKAMWKEYAKAQMDEWANDPTNPEGAQVRDLYKRAKAETDITNWQKIDKSSGYSKAIPKGASARPFIQALSDRIHSPEYAARNEVGARLGDARDSMKQTKQKLKIANGNFERSLKRSEPDEATRAEVRLQKGNMTRLKGLEATHSADYAEKAKLLDAKHPNLDFNTGKVKISSSKAGEAEELALSNKVVDGVDPKTLSAKTPQGKTYLENEVNKANGTTETQKPTAPTKTTPAEEKPVVKTTSTKPVDSKPATPYERGMSDNPNETNEQYNARMSDGKPAKPGLGEDSGGFDPVEIEKLSKLQETEETNAGTRDRVGENAIQENINKSEEDQIKAYMEATGKTREQAEKNLSIVKDDPNLGKVGPVENNPEYGKVDHPDIKPIERKGLGKVLTTSRTVRNMLIEKALKRADGYQKILQDLKGQLHRLNEKVHPEDRVLADNLRGHSIEDVAKDAKDPETFTAYAEKAKYIQDYILEARRVADPTDTTLYRQNYGAGFYSKDPNLPEDYKATNLPAPHEISDKPHENTRYATNYAEHEEFTGRVRNTENFHEDMLKDIDRAGSYIKERSLLGGLRQGFGKDSASFGADKIDGHDQILVKGFKHIYTTPEIAEKINTRVGAKYADKAAVKFVGTAYDKTNKFIKIMKLSIGFFHNINILLTKAALDPSTVGKSVAAWGDHAFFDKAMDKWRDNGTLQKYLMGGGTLDAGVEFRGRSAVDRVPGVGQLHRALFERQIIYSKIADFEKYTKGIDINTPEGYEKIVAVGRNVNDMYGGINRLSDGLNPNQFKWASRVLLAADYNEGQIRAVITAFTKGGVEGTMAKRMVFGRMAELATPGTIQYLANPNSKKDPTSVAKEIVKQLADPTFQTDWKTGGGNPKQINGLATMTNKIYRAFAPMFNPNNPDKFSGIKQELTGNLAAGASFIESEVKNKDYYGNPMHGKGMTLAQDAGAAVNAVAPIPFGPGARALEGVKSLANNSFVKIAAGGQSAITPGEAAVDISGVGRVAANPDAPQMQIMNNRQLVAQGLKGNAQAQQDLYAVHPSWDQSLSKQEVANRYNDPYYESIKWAAMQNSTTFDALKKQNDFAVAHGNPGDPLFNLSSQDQKTILEYKKLSEVDPSANDTAAVMFVEHKDLITQYDKDAASYATAMQALYKSSGGLSGSPANTPAINPGGVPYPAVLADPKNQALLQNYYGITDPKAKLQFLTDNPDIRNLFEAKFNNENAKRAIQGEPLLKDYPQAPAGLQDWMTQYTNASKAGRAALRNGNMDNFKAMGNYMTQIDEYDLAKTAGQAKFQGHDFSQSNLKEIYNLGKYGIAPTVNSNGTTSYSIDPQGAYNANKKSGSSSANSKLLNDLQRIEAVKTVKFMGRKVSLKKQKFHAPYQRPMVRIKTPQPGKIRVKSVPVV